MRIIDTKEVRRIGAEQTTPIDVRIIASVRGNILEEINPTSSWHSCAYILKILITKIEIIEVSITELLFNSFTSFFLINLTKIK